MHAYFVKCVSFVKDEDGKVTEVHCTYDPETKAGSGFTGRKVKGTIHWVPAPYAQKGGSQDCMRILSMRRRACIIRRMVSLNLNPNFS